ncbi:hypothetical protein D9M69_679520 [compost metagenome]
MHRVQHHHAFNLDATGRCQQLATLGHQAFVVEHLGQQDLGCRASTEADAGEAAVFVGGGGVVVEVVAGLFYEAQIGLIGSNPHRFRGKWACLE